MISRLNYRHLYYFWTVAREASLSRAAERLHLTPQTVCTQIKALEERLGVSLLRREGHRLLLTQAGQLVYRYAEEIFSLGEELLERLRGEPPGRFRVGVVDALPKTVAFRLLAPLLSLSEPLLLICRDGDLEQLSLELASHRLELILSDHPLTGASVRAYNHLLGSCGITFMASRELARRYREGFPKALEGAPFLMVGQQSALRRGLERWFATCGIAPRVVAELDDSALLKVFGQAGAGLFCVPTLVEEEVAEQFGVEVVGRSEEVRVQFYAISLERRLSHPAVAAIFETGRRALGGASTP